MVVVLEFTSLLKNKRVGINDKVGDNHFFVSRKSLSATFYFLQSSDITLWTKTNVLRFPEHI